MSWLLPWPILVLCVLAAAPAARAASDLGPRLEGLEARIGEDPFATAEALVRLRAQASADERVAAMLLEGGARDLMGDQDGTLRLAATLDAEPGRGARSAAELLRAMVAFTRDSRSEVAQHLDAAEAALPLPAPHWLLERLVAMRAGVSSAAGRDDEAVRHMLHGIELADRTGNLRKRSNARQALAWTYLSQGQLDKADALATEARQLAEADGSQVTLAHALQAEGFVRMEQGRREEARPLLEQALALATQAKVPAWEIDMLANMADFHLKGGEFARALELSEQALPRARALGDPAMEALALTNSGLAKLMLARIAEGRADIEAALVLEQRLGDVPSMSQTLLEAGEYLERAGQWGAAWDAYTRRRPMAEQVSRAEQQKAMLRWQEDFDQRQRQRELTLLSQQGQLKEQALERQKLRVELGVLAAAAAALALGIVALLARRVRRANKALLQVNAQLREQSEIDPLTGLANRYRVQREMADRARRGPLEGSLFLIDIDHFKRLNDHHGHSAGDQVLVEVARRLREAVRVNDLVVRWGGEEFLVIAHHAGAEDAERMARRMLEGMAGQPVRTDKGVIDFSASVGYARFPLEPGPVNIDWEHAIDLVDAAMYLAKAHGRNRGYGIVHLQASDSEDLSRITASLEASQEHGRVALKLLQGPPVGAGST